MSIGIDYGRGATNIDHETGIRYGVIAQYSVMQAWADSAHPVYPETADDCDEPIGWEYADDGYELTGCLDSDIMVLKSPYYTLAPFCSPCVPGAGDLNSARSDGVKTYCLGHDWFEEGVAPYLVYDAVYDVEIAA
jgi:hypothetical protein